MKVIKKYLETNDNENTAIQNQSDAAKTVLSQVHSNTRPSKGKKKEKPQVT